jgi:RNA polymerase sigma factor (sigma-70 family)
VTHSPETQPSLLFRLRNAGDDLAWTQFVDLYGPLIYRYLRQKGLQDADAADLTQDVLRQVSAAMKTFEYDPQQGRFRGWLFTIVRNRMNTFWQREAGKGQGSGGSAAWEQIQQAVDESSNASAEWDAEFERQMFHNAAQLIRPDFAESTWRAFWRTAVDGIAGRDVARELGMTPAAVYLARSRVLSRLREQVQLLTE